MVGPGEFTSPHSDAVFFGGVDFVVSWIPLGDVPLTAGESFTPRNSSLLRSLILQLHTHTQPLGLATRAVVPVGGSSCPWRGTSTRSQRCCELCTIQGRLQCALA